jgi:hypothetical protein
MRWRWVDLLLGRGESVCESEREGTRVTPGLYTDREKRRGRGRGWWPAAFPFMAGDAKEQEEGEK